MLIDLRAIIFVVMLLVRHRTLLQGRSAGIRCVCAQFRHSGCGNELGSSVLML